MMNSTRQVSVYACAEPVSMRRSFDGLLAVARQSIGKIAYLCNTAKNLGKGFCENRRHRAEAVDQEAFRLLVSGLKSRRDELLADPSLVAMHVPDNAGVTEALQAANDQRGRLLAQHEMGFITDHEPARRMVPVQEKIAALTRSLNTDNVATLQAEVKAVIDRVETLWPELPFELKRKVLGVYVPGGFKLYKGKLEAEVCGVPVKGLIKKGTPGRRAFPTLSAATSGDRLSIDVKRGHPFAEMPSCRTPNSRFGEPRPEEDWGSLSERRDSNPRPPLPQSGALPSCATPRR